MFISSWPTDVTVGLSSLCRWPVLELFELSHPANTPSTLFLATNQNLVLIFFMILRGGENEKLTSLLGGFLNRKQHLHYLAFQSLTICWTVVNVALALDIRQDGDYVSFPFRPPQFDRVRITLYDFVTLYCDNYVVCLIVMNISN